MHRSFDPYRPPKFNLFNFGLAAFIVYGLVVYRYTFNFPYLDDFDAILRFLNQYSLTHGVDSFLMLAGQHNEHRVFLTHLFAVITLKTLGNVNFSALVFLGNLGWLLVIAVFWRYAKHHAISFVEFLPIPIVLLSFSHWGMMTWAMTSIQQYWQILFCLLCIYNLCSRRNFFAILFFIAAIFTGGGGLVLAPLIALYFFSKRQWIQLICTVFLIFILLFVYFYALPYTPPGASKLFDSIAHPLRFLAFFFGFLGGAFNFSFVGPVSYICAGGFLFYLVMRKLRWIYLQNDFVSWTLYFILMCALLGAINRSDLGIESGGASHYSVYSLLLICCLYILVMTHIKIDVARKKFFFYYFCLGVLLFGYWAWKAPIYLEDRHHLLKHEYVIYPDEQAAEIILKKAKDLQIFIAPPPQLN